MYISTHNEIQVYVHLSRGVSTNWENEVLICEEIKTKRKVPSSDFLTKEKKKICPESSADAYACFLFSLLQGDFGCTYTLERSETKRQQKGGGSKREKLY